MRFFILLAFPLLLLCAAFPAEAQISFGYTCSDGRHVVNETMCTEDAKPPEEKASPRKLQRLSIPFRSVNGEPDRNGYGSAWIEMKYGFISCMGEIHLAYSLDPESVQTHPLYYLDGEDFPSDLAPPPKPSSIDFSGKVQTNLGRYIATFNDGNAGPALGFGCFDGQSQKLGSVADLVGSRAGKEEVEEFMSTLQVDVTPVVEPLRNIALESLARQQRREVAQQIEKEAGDRAAARQTQAEARLARQRAADAEFERRLADWKAADEKFARDKAAHEAAVAQGKADQEIAIAKAKAAEEEYRRQVEEHNRLLATGNYAQPQ